MFISNLIWGDIQLISLTDFFGVLLGLEGAETSSPSLIEVTLSASTAFGGARAPFFVGTGDGVAGRDLSEVIAGADCDCSSLTWGGADSIFTAGVVDVGEVAELDDADDPVTVSFFFPPYLVSERK